MQLLVFIKKSQATSGQIYIHIQISKIQEELFLDNTSILTRNTYLAGPTLSTEGWGKTDSNGLVSFQIASMNAFHTQLHQQKPYTLQRRGCWLLNQGKNLTSKTLQKQKSVFCNSQYKFEKIISWNSEYRIQGSGQTDSLSNPVLSS